MSRCDVLVSGSGVAGAVVAIGLARAGMTVGLIERTPPPPPALVPDNRRVVALSPASVQILSALGQWPLVPGAAAPYRQMQVQAGAHQLRFDQAVDGAAALGWIVDLHALQQALWQALLNFHAAGEPHSRHTKVERPSPLNSPQPSSNIGEGVIARSGYRSNLNDVRGNTVQVFAPARIESSHTCTDGVRVALDDGRHLTARLLVAAEGGRSDLRERAGIGVSGRDYQSSALTAQLRSATSNPGIAFQRFAAGGPLALLPLADGRSSLVWTRPQAAAERLAVLPDAEFIAELQAAGGDRFGPVLEVAARQAFPLRLMLAERVTAERLVLIGDSAHVVHPLAGLGLNLGLLDAAALIETLAQAKDHSRDFGAATTLARYAAWRHGENLLAARLIDQIERVFGAADGPLSALAARGLGLVDALAPLRQFFARQAAGWGGRVPKLARRGGDAFAWLV